MAFENIRGFAHAAGFAAARRCLRFLVCLFVSLSVSRFAQKLPNGIAFCMKFSEKVGNGPERRRCKYVREVLYHHAKFGGVQIPKTLIFCLSICLFVCFSVRHAFERQKLCARFRHEDVGVQKRF